MAVKRSIFDKPHHQSLELLATQALADGNIPKAFKFADRRCRILPLPEPHSYVLRSEALFRMGAPDIAISDLAKALEIAPDDLAANRRMLAWARGRQQKQAARALIGHERNFDVLRKAIQILMADGQRNFANITVTEEAIEGWAVWQEKSPLGISISNGTDPESKTCAPDPRHPLSDCGNAASFRILRLKSPPPQVVALSISGNAFHSIRTSGSEAVAKPQIRQKRPANSDDHRVTVIVPIYCNFETTRVCLESLIRELNSSGHRAILVNDASPDPQITKYLVELASDPHVEVLSNTHNLGFVGSINRAFNRVSQDDIILLNSDTVVPPGFIDRLATAAQSSSDIGTVTPLSNNGEFTSFPIPNVANPLGSREEIERIDRTTAKFNAGIIIDIPTGIGFCLYITRACLDAIGPLSDEYSPGYLEDADFCLRAHESGFRNVCAPSVYVGHAGSQSFGSEKRALVVRNLALLEQRFPQHRMECARFMAADWLRLAREAIERSAAAIACHPRLLVSGANVIAAVARRRARELASDAEPAMILEIRSEDAQPIVSIKNANGGMPQSLEFNLAISNECESLTKFFKCIEPSAIEFLDPVGTPFQLVDMLLGLKFPYDMFIADAGLASAKNGRIFASEVLFLKRYEIEKPSETLLNAEIGSENWTARWRAIAERAQRILAPSTHAEAFATSVLPGLTIDNIDSGRERRHSAISPKRHATGCHLGFVPVRSCAYEQQLISETAREFGLIRPDISMTVIGTIPNEMELMRNSNVFVTGPVDPDEIEQLAATLGVKYLFMSISRPLFAHPILSAVFSSDVPTAYFDWSMGRSKPKKKDLAIDPRLSFEAIVSALNDWMPGRYRGSSEMFAVAARA
jgi:GT2 family glycosyltransferase